MSRTTILLLAILAAGPATAQQRQQPRRPPLRPITDEMLRPGIGPGQGPQIGYHERYWEYWWFLNQEPLLDLRRILVPTELPEQDAGARRLRRDDLLRILAALQKGLEDGGPELRAAAVLALGKSGEEIVLRRVMETLEDPTVEVRRSAALALGLIGRRVVVEPLAALIVDDRAAPEVRFDAGVALGLAQVPEAGPAFDRLLAQQAFLDLPTTVQGGVAIGVGLTEDPARSAAVRTLLEHERSLNAVPRGHLVLSLGRLRDFTSRDQLLEYLGDDDVHVRRSAALGLGVLLAGTMDENTIRQIARRLSRESDLTVGNYTAIALGRIGGPLAVRVLAERLDTRGSVRTIGAGWITGSNDAQRTFSSLALALTGEPVALRLLRPRFASASDHSYRAALALSLGLLQDRGALKELRKRFKKAKEPVLRSYLALALGMTGDQDRVEDFTRILQNENDIELLPRTAVALTLLKRRTAVEVLRERLAKERNAFALQSVLYSLGLVGDRTCLEPLLEILEKPGRPDVVRRYAAIALGDLMDRNFVSPFGRLRQDFNYASQPDLLRSLLIDL